MKNLLGILVVALIVIGCDDSTLIQDAGTDAGQADAGEDTDTGTVVELDTDTEVSCSLGWYSGDLIIYTQADADAVAGYEGVKQSANINCPLCTNLTGLKCLKAIGGTLRVVGNKRLNTLKDLTNLAGICKMSGDGLYVFDNPGLPDCEVCDLLGRLADTPPVVNIHNNLDDDCSPAPDGC